MALLQPGAAGLDEADHRRAGAPGELEHADDRVGVRLAQRAAHEGRVLGVAEDRPAADPPGAGDDAVAGRRARSPSARETHGRCAAARSVPGSQSGSSRSTRRGDRLDAACCRRAIGAHAGQAEDRVVAAEAERVRDRDQGLAAVAVARALERPRLAGDVVEVELGVALLPADRRRRDAAPQRLDRGDRLDRARRRRAGGRSPTWSRRPGSRCARSPSAASAPRSRVRSLSGVEVPWAFT